VRSGAAYLAGVLGLALASLAAADPPDSSPLPRLRPALAAPQVPEAAADPAEPSDPAATVDPTAPTEPTVDADTATPDDPAEPAAAAEPEDPADPAEPSDPPATATALAAQPAAPEVVTAAAHAPPASLRPPPRPGTAAPPAAAPPDAAAPTVADTPPAQPSVQIERGGLFGGALRPRQLTQVPGATALAAASSLRPELRPDGLEQRVRAAATRQTPGRVTQPGTSGGGLCGLPGLVGDRLEPIPGRIQGCGIAEPVRLRAVDGIALSTPATINCNTARALQTWVQGSLVPTVGRTGGGVRSLRVVASYACRARNNQAGARVSEHGRGNAIDIAGIGLQNGSELTVLTGWRERRTGELLRDLHRGACGPFGTVLGPNSDRFHQDHFHFDVAAYRSGSYCR